MIDKAAIVCTKPKQDARKSLTISLMDKQYRSYCHRARRCDVCKSSRLPNIFRSTHYKQAKSIPRSVSTISVNYFRYFEEPFRPHPHPRIKNKTSTNLNQLKRLVVTNKELHGSRSIVICFYIRSLYVSKIVRTGFLDRSNGT